MSPSEHRLPLRIYLEDTDAQGIVYHANYLRYFERARSEIIESLGESIRNVASVDRRYVVYEMHIKFRQPAFLGDRLEVVTSMQRSSEYRLNLMRASSPSRRRSGAGVTCQGQHEYPAGDMSRQPGRASVQDGRALDLDQQAVELVERVAPNPPPTCNNREWRSCGTGQGSAWRAWIASSETGKERWGAWC